MNRLFAANWRRTVALAVLLGFLPFASACFGSFNPASSEALTALRARPSTQGHARSGWRAADV
jgi:hypothetical protein